ncbi:tRNA (adenosine(37)-N6)-dimethylallyltransferase MiaA [Limnobacter sp.]|uniref:tRNA (adenosine(37)-N6)-dimethylallyltransferase MiaA n=1 Tax=Limnobacter sp. TaxID=2003368 RepID=UPI003513192B
MKPTEPNRIPALAVLGPTASGKSALGVWMAEQGMPIEIISLDSALVFRDMNIGTAKPSAAELAMVPHHLIDVISPSDTFSAADFLNHCTSLVQDIRSRGKVPVILGGTMMYFNALVAGMDNLPPADPQLRLTLEMEALASGWPAMHRRLQALDPVTAQRLKPNDSQRIQRALEVCLLTGQPFSGFLQRDPQQRASLPILSIEPSDRAALHRRIEERFLTMLEDGLVEEVVELKHRYVLSSNMPSMRCVGYRQVWEHLHGQYDHGTMIQKGVAATRQLAKRQLTWLRSTPGKQVVDPLQPNWIQQVQPWLLQHIDQLKP